MRKITVLIEGSEHLVKLSESINTFNYNYICVKKATVYWNYYNIPENLQLLAVGSDVVNIYAGYYTFDDLNDILLNNISVKKRPYTGKCELFNSRADGLKLHSRIIKMLGFPASRTVFNRGSVISTNQVDMNNGLKYIRIDCDIVNELMNVDNKGKRSSTILPQFQSQLINHYLVLLPHI